MSKTKKTDHAKYWCGWETPGMSTYYGWEGQIVQLPVEELADPYKCKRTPTTRHSHPTLKEAKSISSYEDFFTDVHSSFICSSQKLKPFKCPPTGLHCINPMR